MGASEWPKQRFDAAAARSVAVHGNRAVLPVAGWILESGSNDVTAPEVVRGVRGELAPNKALEALVRIVDIGALEELPYVGRPYPRTFRRRSSSYWALVRDELRAIDGSQVSRD